MKTPLSWLREFVEITLPVEDLAQRLTMAGLEVEEIRYVGLPNPAGPIEGSSGGHVQRETKLSGFAWDRDKIVVGAVLEVMPHPNADRLVLTRLDDGEREHIVLTGAPNLFPYKGQGTLEKPLKVAYAKEGAQIYDGHQPGQVLTTLKRAKIRGVESYSMACSEKELGISDEHEGIIILDDDAPVGLPLADYMGDAVLDIAIAPNIARDANILGVAREIAALTNQPLRQPSLEVQANGPQIEDMVSIQIQQPELNPRFVLGLVQNVEIKPSPYKVQRRLRLCGVRPINNIVDATNYAMLEIGEPLHAFDYDVLVQRAGGKTPTIITRSAKKGEHLTTLDGVERRLDDFTVLVCDTAGSLSIAGVMGGLESEVSSSTRNVLLEGAAWNYINIRKTITSQRLQSEAAYRFSRGVHPAQAERGVRRGLEYMRQWAGGTVCKGLVDNYPLPPKDPTVEITTADAERWLGIQLTAQEIADILQQLEFKVEVDGQRVRATAPDHRLDIGTGITGVADLLEEVARVFGYDRIPETRLSDGLPHQIGNPSLEQEERLRDLLVNLGLQEVITYRMTTPEREARRLAPGTPANDRPYVVIANPIVNDRNALRQSLLSSLLEVVERNVRVRERIAIFEISPVFFGSEDKDELPEEQPRLVVLLSGPRHLPGWQPADTSPMDFYDLKGVTSAMLEGMSIPGVTYQPASQPSFHPGKCARVMAGERQLGVIGELHPQVRAKYDLPSTPLLAGDFNLEAILDSASARYDVSPVPAFPPVLEDLAVIVDEDLPAEKIEAAIRAAGGKMVTDLRLFDVYRGDQVGAGKKSLAYSLTYQATDRTLTDAEAAKIRQRIIRQLELDLGAKLRG
jgi:phenylalanyl-tRNA synthetase beta chain